MKKKKTGRPRLRKAIDEYKEFYKNRKKPNYRPDESYPTTKEAKKILNDIYVGRGYKVKSVRINLSGFTVCFVDSKKTFDWSDEKKGGGPYGLDKMHITWQSVKRIIEKNSEAK